MPVYIFPLLSPSLPNSLFICSLSLVRCSLWLLGFQNVDSTFTPCQSTFSFSSLPLFLTLLLFFWFSRALLFMTPGISKCRLYIHTVPVYIFHLLCPSLPHFFLISVYLVRCFLWLLALLNVDTTLTPCKSTFSFSTFPCSSLPFYSFSFSRSLLCMTLGTLKCRLNFHTVPVYIFLLLYLSLPHFLFLFLFLSLFALYDSWDFKM